MDNNTNSEFDLDLRVEQVTVEDTNARDYSGSWDDPMCNV